jgi:hypothetical protein
MPTPTSVGDVWQVVVKCRIEQQEHLNVWHFQAATAIGDVETALLLAIIQCLEPFVTAHSAPFVFEGLVAKQVAPVLGPIIEMDPTGGTDITGEALGDAGVSFNSVCVSIHTTRGGRTGRGRIFFGGIPESATMGSSFIQGSEFWLALGTFLVCIATKFIRNTADLNPGQVWDMGIMSRKLGGLKPPYQTAGFARATKLIPNTLVKSTVSRKIGKGS